MNIRDEILINQFAQSVVTDKPILERFGLLALDEKRNYLIYLIDLIQQSKPLDTDIPKAIEGSNQRLTFTPCVMLRKGVATHNLIIISKLPEYELTKVLKLFLSLFKIAYLRRFAMEKDHSGKWWYWDLSNQDNVELALKSY